VSPQTTLVAGLLMALAIFLTLFGVATFVVGLMPGPSAPWWRQYAYAAIALTCAYLLFEYVLGMR